MKKSKQFKRIILISLALVAFMAITRCSYAGNVEDIMKKSVAAIGEGLVAIAVGIYQEGALLIFVALQAITAAITGLTSDDGFAGTIGSVVFNKCGLTTANFFGTTSDTTIATLTSNVGKYYLILRALSIALLLGILLYTGIRMAISTVASDEAKYKKMFQNWLVSLVLVFVLHYIIILTFTLNDALVNVLSKLDTTSIGNFAELVGKAAIPGAGIPYLIVYGCFVVGTLAFVLMYVKRIIVLAFLIVISPLITVTYSIDKIGDGKSQALNTWLKEFIFTVLIQPFHCIIYLVFYSSIMSSVGGSVADALDLGKMIFAVASAFFMLNAENIVKKIFGIQPSNMGTALGTGAMALNMTTGLLKNRYNGGKKLDKSKGKMPEMQSNSSVLTRAERQANEEARQQAGQNNNAQGGAASQSQSNGSGSGNSQANENGASTPPAGDANTPGGAPNNGSAQNPNDGAANGNQQQGNADGQQARADATPKQKNKKKRNIGGFLLDYEKKKAKNIFAGSAAFAGAIAGAAVGEDLRTAVDTGLAGYNIGKASGEKMEYNRAEKQLAKNQEVFAGAYEDFARAYREEHGDVDDQVIRAEAKRIYESDGNNLKTEAERDFYAQMEKMSDSAEIMGYSDGFDYINETMRQVDEEILLPGDDYVPKFYERTRAENNTRRRNNRRNNTDGNESGHNA